MKIVSCPSCGLTHTVPRLTPGTVAECVRCRSVIEKETKRGLARTAAFSLAALCLYVPANIFPILHLDLYGAVANTTVWQSSKRLYQDGDHVVAGVVFLASIVVPLCKLLTLIFLVVSTQFRSKQLMRTRTWMHRAIQTVGPWAMLDVFIVAILIALVKLKKLATILPGPGLLSFTAVVILTMLASASFDSKSIWENDGEKS